MLFKILIGVGVLSIAGLVMLLTTTNPTEAGPIGVLAVCIASYAGLVSLFSFVVFYVRAVYVKILLKMKPALVLHTYTLKRSYLHATVFALVPILLVGLRSVSGFAWYDIVLVALFVGVGTLYVAKRA